MNSASVTGSSRPTGSPSTSSPTRPWSRCMAKRSGRSVCSSWGKGESGASTMASSRGPTASSASRSMAVQPPGQLPYRGLPGRPLQIEQGHPCAAAAAKAALGELQGGGVQPLAHQGGVHPQGLGEGVLAALQGLFQAGLRHGPPLGAADLKAQRAAQLLEEQQAAAPAEILRRVSSRSRARSTPQR